MQAQNIISVYAEATPNPETLKFVVNKRLVGDQPFDFRSVKDTEGSPLARALFEKEYVNGVFIVNNFVSITKDGDFMWVELIPEIRDFLKSYIEEERPIVNEDLIREARQEAQEAGQGGDDPEDRIRQVLEQSVKPAVEMDGGAIHFKSFEDGVVTLVLKGACSGCPSSIVTLKAGIEGLLKRVVPGVNEVVAEEG